MKDGVMSMPESQEEESSPSQNMQMELHSKGAVLTKAWSDLFSFITKYQAELTVKENSVEIAEREISMRRKQLDEMKPMVEAGNDEISKLQDEIQAKEQLLIKSHSELSMKEQMLQQVQSDLSCNMELLENARSELLDRQSEHVRDRSDLERLKSELIIKQEQILIKDNLLKKLQNQLMKENTELRDQLELERSALELERKSHELTKKSLREKSGPSHSMSTSRSSNVIEIPDSPPTLDLSVEQADDFGLSNIISEAESQSHQMSQLRFSQSQETAPSRISLRTSETYVAHSTPSMTTTPAKRHWSAVQPPSASSPQKFAKVSHTPVSDSEFPQPSDSYNEGTATQSEVFFPLSVDPDKDSKAGIIDTSTGVMYTDSEMPGEGQYSGNMPGTPSSGTSDSNQGPPVMPVSISGAGMSPGQVGPDGKGMHPIDSSLGLRHQDSAVELKGHHLELKVCRLICSSPSSPTDHVGKHTGEKPHKCSVCDKAFSTRAALLIHQQNHPGHKFKCSHCGKEFVRLGSLKQHEMIHTAKICFKCSICEWTFLRKADLKNHMHVHTGKKFQCSQCVRKYTHKRDLLRHEREHSTGPTYYKCNQCEKTYTSRTMLIRHELIHTGERPFKCSDCSKTFLSNAELTTHSKCVHSDETPFQCSHCIKAFKTRDQLVSHSRTHTGEKPYVCSYCDKAFTHRATMKAHIQRIHDGEKRFACPDCKKLFSTPNDVKVHASVHSEDQPYQCSRCGIKFKNKRDCKLHELRHLRK